MSEQLGSDARRCSACKTTRPVHAFAFSNKEKGSLQSYCRACHAAYRHAHYVRNKRDYVLRAERKIALRRLENRRLLRLYLLAHPCVDCGEADPRVLDFDHRDPTAKTQAVTWLAVRKNWTIVAAEIAKCEVRCANCHRIRTAEQFGWSKLRRVSTIAL